MRLPGAGCRVTALLGPESRLPGELGDDARSLQMVRSRWPTHRPVGRVVWEQLVQPRTLRRVRADLAHGPAFVGPLASPCPFVVTVHDLSFLRFPRLLRSPNRFYLRIFTRASVRRARRVIAVSAHAADETVRLLGVRRGAIDVVYHGVAPQFRPLRAEAVTAFRAERGLSEGFVLYLGTMEPRKNLTRLVEAFARLKAPDLQLVLAGGRGWYDAEIFARTEELNLQDRIVFPGYVPEEDLPLWYNAASVFAYPSLYEGFGMQVLEAQACGTPVLTSNCSALPEAAGDGALLVDPSDVGAISEALHRLLTDQALRDDLRRRGIVHAAAFSWQRTAAETIGVYRRALAEDGRA